MELLDWSNVATNRHLEEVDDESRFLAVEDLVCGSPSAVSQRWLPVVVHVNH